MEVITAGQVHIFTFKTGLLSRIAHDLRLAATQFEVTHDAGIAQARFDVDSIRVEGVMRQGRLDEQGLDESNRKQVERTMREEVLHAEEFPHVTYEGVVRERSGGLDVDGHLEMVGQTAPLQLAVERADGWLTGEVELRPSRWGIVPYRAMLGAIQLQDRVLVRFRLREPEL